eukprot:Nitzschia sp. Nitz4//scaffold25_size161228//69211//69867//NITZ4_002429-RA/size161228-processed-gene-0.161-mRNA-1//1//CDS//3329544583//9061//frame0
MTRNTFHTFHSTSPATPFNQGAININMQSPFGSSSCRLIRQVAHRQRFFSSRDTSPSKKNLKKYGLQGVGKESKVDATTNTGHSLSTDVPVYMGGTDTAPQPIETLITAWMGCTQATAVFVGRQMKPRLSIDSLVFQNIQAVRDQRGALSLPIDQTPSFPSRLEQISGTIQVFASGGSKLEPDQLMLLQEQTELRCPVANMIISSGCKMEVEWKDGNA